MRITNFKYPIYNKVDANPNTQSCDSKNRLLLIWVILCVMFKATLFRSAWLHPENDNPPSTITSLV